MDHTTRRDKILNVFDTKIYSEKEILYAYDKPVVIHYGGSIFARPWIKDSNSRFKEIYLNYEKISEWKDIEHVYSHQSIQFNRKYPLEKQLKKIYCLVSKSNNSIINSCWNFLAKVTKKLREKI
ncbi:hypothetical protein SDC9_194556 [bioreactor metagenome]|uniref:Uncharacterized protein n=1 Tax=bioreactor metagenome TaxID=1076179 RepID=A0A645I6J8_9ZZZZ